MKAYCLIWVYDNGVECWKHVVGVFLNQDDALMAQLQLEELRDKTEFNSNISFEIEEFEVGDITEAIKSLSL